MKNKLFHNSPLLIIIFSFGLALFWAAFPPQPLGDLIFGFTKIPLFVFLVLISLGSIGVYISVILKDKEIARFHYWVEYFSERDIVFLFFAVFTTAIIFSWVIFIPNEQLDPSISEYQKRLMPLFVWMFFTSFVFLDNLILVIKELNQRIKKKVIEKKILASSIIILIVCVVIGLFIGYSKYGIIPIRHWEKNGVPVLFRQILILVWGITGWLVIVKPKILKLEIQCRRGWRIIISHLDTLFFLLIWLIAAIIWISEPLPFNMFNPGSIPPDYVHYPFSDALYGYDLTAQKALIGVEEQSLSKPAYSGFLFILHVFVGQNFELLLATQTAILAIFPAVAYLIGKKLYNRALGFAISFLIIVQTWNSIKGNLWIWKVAHPKMEMTDFPVAVVISIFVLFLITWYQERGKKHLYLICSGASLGLAVLVRDNAWLLLPLPLLLILIKESKLKKVLLNLMFFVLGLLLIISPWMIQNYKIQGTPIYFWDKIQYVIVGDRYLHDSNVEQDIEKKEEQIETESNDGNSEYLELLYQSLPSQITERLIGHYVHGLVTIAFSTPPLINYDNLRYTTTVSLESKDIWEFPWNGTLSTRAGLVLLLNLSIFSLGLSALWNKKRFLGILPLGVLLLYLLADALAFTSGGRYIIPINWCYHIYYAMGLVVIIQKTLTVVFPGNIDSAFISPDRHLSYKRKPYINLVFLAIIFLLGATPAVMGYIFPKQYQVKTKSEAIIFLESTDFFEIADSSKEALINFSNNQQTIIQYGRILYPRFIEQDKNEFAKILYSNFPSEEPFIVFSLLNSNPEHLDTYMPISSIPENFSHGTEVVVIGCKEGKHIRAFNIFVVNKNELWISEYANCSYND